MSAMGGPAPGIGGAPGPMPMSAPMGAPPAGPQPPPRPPAQGLGPASPLAQIFQNLSTEMSDGWQMLDGCVRMLKLASRSADFAEKPNIAAVITDQISTLSTLISHHTSKGASNDASPMSAASSDELPDDGGEENDSRAYGSADADTLPEA